MYFRLLCVGALAAFACACGSTENATDETSAASTGSECSSGTPRDDQTPIPYEPGASDTTYPACTARCGAVVGASGFYPVSGLPSGTCSGSATCDMPAEVPCACAGTQGPVNGYRCTCADGSWQCSMISPGAGTCACADASAP